MDHVMIRALDARMLLLHAACSSLLQDCLVSRPRSTSVAPQIDFCRFLGVGLAVDECHVENSAATSVWCTRSIPRAIVVRVRLVGCHLMARAVYL